VIEAYGMTEASHQMASNPLPPRPRKPASVGLPAGPEIAILDAEGRRLAAGERGEIAIRGASVTAGYAANAEANARSFTDGWFRTGDEGYLDADGYLFLSGRLKEMINRGGEKIAPVEIDRVMLDHPAVAQAIAFALPHPRLGEDVGVAVVLREGLAATQQELRAFARERLAAFKVPSLFAIVGSIPKGATGKPQRIGLAGRLGISARAADSPAPATPLQLRVAEVWAELLDLSDPRLGDHFFLAGGDSIVSAQLLSRVERMFGIELSVERFFDSPTLGELAAMAEEGLLARLASLSDEEAASLLGQGS
jgi:acyl carrier protein